MTRAPYLVSLDANSDNSGISGKFFFVQKEKQYCVSSYIVIIETTESQNFQG